MEKSKYNSFYTITILIGMLGVFESDVLFSGLAESIGILASSSIILGSLIAKLISNHEVIMESAAPGARLYQSFVFIAQVVFVQSAKQPTKSDVKL